MNQERRKRRKVVDVVWEELTATSRPANVVQDEAMSEGGWLLLRSQGISRSSSDLGTAIEGLLRLRTVLDESPRADKEIMRAYSTLFDWTTNEQAFTKGAKDEVNRGTLREVLERKMRERAAEYATEKDMTLEAAYAELLPGELEPLYRAAQHPDAKHLTVSEFRTELRKASRPIGYRVWDAVVANVIDEI
jgi:hypothetical protein